MIKFNTSIYLILSSIKINTIGKISEIKTVSPPTKYKYFFYLEKQKFIQYNKDMRVFELSPKGLEYLEKYKPIFQ